MKKFTLLSALLAAGTLSGAAFAEGDKAPEFSQADTDGDGKLSIEEAREALPQEVVIVDTNNDGMLNRNEVQAAMPEVSLAGDAGQDSAIGEEEYDQIRESLEGGTAQQDQQESELTDEDSELEG